MIKRKIIISGIIILCIPVIAIGVTLAFLRDSKAITNTFTIGNLSIELDEPSYHEPEGGTRLIPGMAPIPKDPTVTLIGEDAYVFMQIIVTEELGEMIEDVEIGDNWERVEWVSSNNYGMVYIYAENEDYKTVGGELPGTTLDPLFTQIKIKREFDPTIVTDFSNSDVQSIVVKAVAVQHSGLSEKEALEAFEWAAVGSD